MRKRWWIIGGVSGLVLLAGVAHFQHARSGNYSQFQPQAVAASGYLDPALCAGCHVKIAQTYKLSGMGRSFYRPSHANTIGLPHQSHPYYHKASDSYFSIFERDGRFFQRRYQVGFGGKETNAIEKEIDFVIGSGNHVRAYLHHTSRNTLVELPLAWYSENGGYWAMNAGYDRPDHPGFRRTITYQCMFCHNGIPEIPATGADPVVEPVFTGSMPEGIDCQRCHGPGAKHVAATQTYGATLEQIRGTIVNPARLNPDRELEVCLQCHLETTSYRLPNSTVRYERGPFSYQPGEPLADFMFDFDRIPANEKFEIAGQGYRLRRSACFQMSAGRLRCTTCHNPHDVSRGEPAALHYNQVCRQCHEAAISKLAATAKHTQSADCIGCHMPKRRTDDAVHVVITDHYIQRRKPARDLLAPLVEWRETSENSYRGEVVPYYPRPLPPGQESDLYLAMAQVSHNSNLAQGIAQLTAAIERDHPARIEYSLQLGDALAANGQKDKAISVYEEAVRQRPHSYAALRKLASGLQALGQLPRAGEILKQALEADPGDAVGWHELGLVYLNQGMQSEAVVAFQKAISLDEDFAEADNSLGGVLLESGELPRAEAAFREAIRIQPDYAEAHSNLGNTLGLEGRFEEARYHFEAALRLQPNYAAARFNYAIALSRAKRFEEAQRQLEAMLRVEPTNAQAHDLLGNLLIAGGKLQPALDQFGEAVRLRPEFGRARLDLGEALADSGNTYAALSHLRAAAQSQEPAVRQEAAELLQRLGAR